jgi:hypothetical protein
MRSLMRPLLLLTASLLFAPVPADATARLTLSFIVPPTVHVGFAPAASEVGAGDSFEVELRAGLDVPVLGFGLDLAFDPLLLALESTEIAAPWIGLFAPDRDGLAGAAPDAGIAGIDVLLAVLRFSALAPGTSPLLLSVTPGDLTEGFALDPSGFAADPFFAPGSVRIVPEPGTGLLVAGGLAALALRRTWNHSFQIS